MSRPLAAFLSVLLVFGPPSLGTLSLGNASPDPSAIGPSGRGPWGLGEARALAANTPKRPASKTRASKSPPSKSPAPRASAPPKPPLQVALVWHQHQPKYPKEPGTNIYTMPWVRLHAAKDYVDMAEIVERYPGLRLTFNLTPVLLEQVLDYGKGASDRALILSQKPALALDADDKAYLDAKFFDVSEAMMKRFPAYAALAAKPRSAYTTQDWRDLQVWFNLAWLDPDVLAREPFAELVRKGRGFGENDKARVLNQHLAMLKEIVPLHRRLQAEGKIEVSTTPYFHPILPLVHDSDSAREALPAAMMPQHRFQQADDARRHVQMAAESYRKLFGRAPRGMWPAEGAVGQAVSPIYKEEGISWIASDEGVLSRSLGIPLREGEVLTRPDDLYRPYQVVDGPAILFRDRLLSDAIGFRYSKMSGQAAAADLLAKLKRAYEATPAGASQLVTLVLDGENAWEHYPDDGKAFFHALYRGLTQSPWVKTVTPSEVVARQTLTPLPHLWAGSWIEADFSTWIGEDEENRAWDLLADAQAALDQYRLRHGANARFEKARRVLMAAQGSDWFWWYGKDQESGRDDEFDAAFRGLLREAYGLIGEPAPTALNVPIVPAAIAVDREPQALITPPLDGKLGPEWQAAGYVAAAGGAMAQSRRIFDGLRYGWDEDALFLAIAYKGEPLPTELSAGGFRATLDPGQSQASLRLDGKPVGTIALAKGARHVELRLPWSALSSESRAPLGVSVAAAGAVFPARPLSVRLPVPRGRSLVTFSDPAGDALGAGKLVPPANPQIKLANFDLRGLEVGEHGSDYVFTFTLGQIDNLWKSPSGLSLPTLDLYLDTGEPVAGYAPLLPGRRAQAESPWTHALWIEGWQSGLYGPGGQRITEIRTTVEPLSRRVVVKVPKTLLPGHPTRWRYLAFTLAQDGYSVGRVRGLSARHDFEHFSGNAAPILDILAERDDQERLLSPIAEKTVLPLHRAPDLPASRPSEAR